MLKRVLRLVAAVLGGVVGLSVSEQLQEMISLLGMTGGGVGLYSSALSIGVACVCGGALIFFLLSFPVFKYGLHFVRWIENKMAQFPMLDIVFGTIGMILGLLAAFLLTTLYSGFPWAWFGLFLSVCTYIFMGYLGLFLGATRWNETPLGIMAKNEPEPRRGAVPKLLDTSVIIDGRIFEICKTGFVEGPLVVPGFVLSELRHIADSSDALKRNRGRRGLDVINKIQNELSIEVIVDDADYDDISEVDAKLLRYAQEHSGLVITNDFNLNKVAKVWGVLVLNVNELANALKPVLLPGEEMVTQVVREGKEAGQGVGYLDDGTMIVIDNGRRYVGEEVEIVVTTVLQTPAGVMIFSKLKSA